MKQANPRNLEKNNYPINYAFLPPKDKQAMGDKNASMALIPADFLIGEKVVM